MMSDEDIKEYHNIGKEKKETKEWRWYEME